jgi:hypothetical protein
MMRLVTDNGVVARGRGPGGRHRAAFQRGTVGLRRHHGLHPIRLMLSHEYIVRDAAQRQGWWEAVTTGWTYNILDHGGRTIVAFHWHPEGSGRVTWPHLHAYSTHESVELHKLHPPTGTITAGSVVRFLIEDLDVLPRRPDWQAILEHHEDV